MSKPHRFRSYAALSAPILQPAVPACKYCGAFTMRVNGTEDARKCEHCARISYVRFYRNGLRTWFEVV